MLLNAPAPFVGDIKYKAVTSSLSGEGSLLKVGSFSFFSPVSAPTFSKPIFDIKATDNKNNVSTPMLYGSVKNVQSFGYTAASDLPKSSGDGFAAYSSTSRSGGFKFG